MSVCCASRDHQADPFAFTLVELLTVIAKIGILAALLIPTVGSVLGSATRTQAASNIRQIALAYVAYANSKSDPAVANYHDLPKTMGTFDKQGRLVQNNLIGTPVSWTLATGISPRAPVSTTPLAWTRGLKSNGYWAPDSPWEGWGGHIVYLNGHVEWYNNLVGDGLNSNGLLIR